MKLYVAQHGDAVPKGTDPQRPLSPQGRADVQRIGAFLGQAGVRVSTIRHSGKTRAEQTAELLAASVGHDARMDKTTGIDPLDPTGDFARTVNGWATDTLVVGHQPFMGKLVSRLVTGDEAGSIVAFRPGTVVCLERGDDGSWSIAWMVRPELVGRTSR